MGTLVQVKAMERVELPLRVPAALLNSSAARHSFLYQRSGTPQCVRLREIMAERAARVVGVLYDKNKRK
jgi:hypothetical protein